jgi:hypothetical protein
MLTTFKAVGLDLAMETETCRRSSMRPSGVSSAKSATNAWSMLIPRGIGRRQGGSNAADPHRTQAKRLACSNKGIEKDHSNAAPESIITKA